MTALQTGLVTLLWILISCSLATANPIKLEEGKKRYKLGLYLDILEDINGNRDIKEITSPALSKKFLPSSHEMPTRQYTNAVFWVRFTVINPLNRKVDLYLEHQQTFIDQVELVAFDNSGELFRKRGGRQTAFRDTDYKYRYPVFKISLAANSSRQFYMRFKSFGPMNLFLQMWHPDAFQEKVVKEQLFLGFYYGIMVVMLFYNLFLFLSLRDKSYLYYVFFISMLIWYQLNADGTGYQYFWWNLEWMSRKASIIGWIFSMLSYILFSRSFLKSREHAPKTDRLLLMVVCAGLVNAVISQLGFMTLGIQIGVYIQLGGTVLLFYVCLMSIQQKYRPAKYYFAAMAMILLGAVLTLLKNMGAVPESFLTNYGSHIGSSLEVILLSLGLADRINTIKEEKLEAQAKAYNAEHALTEALEKQVKERTDQVNTLSGLLPMCASCKKIRNDDGYWEQVESYIEDHSDAHFSHGMCGECAEKIYGNTEWYKKGKREGKYS